ncbi:MAG: helix-turn-helix transcriptional regulator [Burkholderiales bacterium]|nr:helix-turn-helix transcriptional regulator [Burkholderiales bacterium]
MRAKDAKPTDADRAAAAYLSQLWEDYKRAHTGRDGKRPTQNSIIEATGLSQSAISQYMKGRLRFGYGAVLKFAAFFKVPPKDIYPGLDALPSAPPAGQSQPVGIDLGTIRETLVALKKLVGTGVEMDLYDAAPILTFILEERLRLPAKLNKAQLLQFDAAIREELKDHGIEWKGRAAGDGAGSAQNDAPHGKKAGAGAAGRKR